MATKDATKSTKTRKTTTKKKAEDKVVVDESLNSQDAVAQMKAATEAMNKMAEATTKAIKQTEKSVKEKKKEYDEESLIECRSVTEGELILIGKKSGTKYIWAGFGDTTEVEVQDLNSLRASKSEYIFKPYFLIDDEDFIKQDKWADLKKMYDKIEADDVEDILKLDNASFKRVLTGLPKGLQSAVKSAIATEVLNDTFDSLQKVKIVDEVLGSDLKSLLK